MRKIILTVLLLCLLFAEIYLCAAFLPMSWQDRLQSVFPQSYDHSVLSHPNIEGEIAQTLQHHPGLRMSFYGILIVMVALNTVLLRLVWKALSRT